MARKIIYIEPTFFKRRVELVDMCVDLRRQGKTSLYILPSREAIWDVRLSLFNKGRGITDWKVITMDELEKDIACEFILENSILHSAVARIVLDKICRDLSTRLSLFQKIAHKKGFVDDIHEFIRTCKRQNVAPDDLITLIDNLDDSILKSKLKDIHTIYSYYENYLKERGNYVIDDIPLVAYDKVFDSSYLDDIHTIIIDGFIHIDPIDMKIIGRIAHRNDIDIYINVPYMNKTLQQFVDEELVNSLMDMGFCIDSKMSEDLRQKSTIYSLVHNLYTGRVTDIDHEILTIKRYPCVDSELRETARDIKDKLINGEKPCNIAVYMDDRDEYGRVIQSIFKEFQIPIKYGYGYPVSSTAMFRELLGLIEGMEVNMRYWIEWLGIVENYLLQRQDNVMDREAWDKTHDVFNTLRSSLEDSDLIYTNISKEEFLNYLTGWAISTTIEVESGDDAGVRILGTDYARGQLYNHIYILGMNDGIMPNIPSRVGIFNIQERDQLMDMGINYKNQDWEFKREKIRLCLALVTAKKSITLSYRETERGDNALIPSSFIEEIKLATGITQDIMTVEERFNVSPDKIVTSREQKLMLLKDKCEEIWKGQDLKTSIDSLVKYNIQDREDIENLLCDGYIHYHRQCSKYFNNYEGIVGTENLPLGNDFYLGASDIDRFYFCPYAFFMGRLMGGSVFEQNPKEYDNMDAGSFYHAVLREYYKGLDNFDFLDRKRLQTIYAEILDTEIRELDLPREELDVLKNDFFNPLYEAIGVFISKDLKRLKEYEGKTGRILRPIMLERGIENSHIFNIKMRCKVDRVDMEFEKEEGKWTATGRFVIYDYKKGKSKGLDHILRNNVCQLGIYYFLIEEEFRKMGFNAVDCMALLYYGIEENSEDDGKGIKYDGIYREEYKKALGLGRKHYAMDSEVFEAFLQYIREITIDAVDMIRAGKFPYAPNCPVYTERFARYSCEYKDICRYSRDKIIHILDEGGHICYGEAFRGL